MKFQLPLKLYKIDENWDAGFVFFSDNSGVSIFPKNHLKNYTKSF